MSRHENKLKKSIQTALHQEKKGEQSSPFSTEASGSTISDVFSHSHGARTGARILGAYCAPSRGSRRNCSSLHSNRRTRRVSSTNSARDNSRRRSNCTSSRISYIYVYSLPTDRAALQHTARVTCRQRDSGRSATYTRNDTCSQVNSNILIQIIACGHRNGTR